MTETLWFTCFAPRFGICSLVQVSAYNPRTWTTPPELHDSIKNLSIYLSIYIYVHGCSLYIFITFNFFSPLCMLKKKMHTQLCPTLQPCELEPARLLCPWDFPGKNTGVGCHFLLQGIFPPRDWTRVSHVSCIAGGFFTTELPGKPRHEKNTGHSTVRWC